MKIHSIFYSIDGEVNMMGQGTPSVFLRLQGCSLQCPWCFGIKPGRRIPRIILSEKSNKKLPEVQVGDKLLTFSQYGTLVETEVTQIHNRFVDVWLEITIQGKVYFVTEEHPFFTTRGLVSASDLVQGDMIYHSSFNDKLSFSKLGDKNPMKRPEVSFKGLYKPSFSLLSEERQDEVSLLISKSKIGSKNPNWKGGLRQNFDRLKKEAVACSRCGSAKNINVHHKDRSPKNDSINNLEVLCHRCHCQEHEVGYNFWNGDRVDGKCLLKLQNGFEVQKIKRVDRYSSKFFNSTMPAPLQVFNLTCYPFNSYLVDYMWVHNCDTKDSQDPDKYWKDVSALEVKNMLLDFFPSDMKGPKITITGGEPLLQEDEVHELLNYLFPYGIKLSIETNGTVSLEKFLRPKPNPDICLVVDWKPDSARTNKYFDWLNRAEYDRLRPWDWIKFPVACREDYEQARDFIRQLDTQARKAMSPIMGKYGVTERQYCPLVSFKQVWQWMCDDGLHDVCLNAQLHKFLNLA